MKKHLLPFSVEAILAEDEGRYEKKPALMSGEGNINVKYIYIYSDKLQYNCTVTRLYNITIQLYSDKAIEKTT